jgi:hypothetical protein
MERMIKIGWISFLGAMLLVSGANANEKPFFCAMTKAQANDSEDCLRYYMQCSGFDPDLVSPIFKKLPITEQLKMNIKAKAGVASVSCKRFSYVEADAAVRLLSR